MGTRLTVARRRERLRDDVAGAILLVAEGLFREVQIANVPLSRAQAAPFREPAALQGVELTIGDRADGPGMDLRVRRL